jgi:hypothetical protein
MKTFTKLLVASALAASFAAPALAGEEALIAERNAAGNTQQSWTQNYAMDSMKSKDANVTWSNASKDLSIATQ